MWSILKPAHAAIHWTLVSIDTKVSVARRPGSHYMEQQLSLTALHVGCLALIAWLAQDQASSTRRA